MEIKGISLLNKGILLLVVLCGACADKPVSPAAQDLSSMAWDLALRGDGGSAQQDVLVHVIQDLRCKEDEHVKNHRCEPCLPGTTNAAGDDASGDNTSCDPILCATDQHVVSHQCVACTAGTTNTAGDIASGDNTPCDADACAENQHVVGHQCVACAAGMKNAAGDDASGSDTSCEPILCAEDERVEDHRCLACVAGTTNAAGDDASGSNTSCDATQCGEDEHVVSYRCVACPSGTTNRAGDDASGSNTSCDATRCAQDQHVSSHQCVACPAGTTNATGDDASGDNTSCDPVLCATDDYVDNHQCVACPAGTENAAGDDASGSNTSCDPIVFDSCLPLPATGEPHKNPGCDPEVQASGLTTISSNFTGGKVQWLVTKGKKYWRFSAAPGLVAGTGRFVDAGLDVGAFFRDFSPACNGTIVNQANAGCVQSVRDDGPQTLAQFIFSGAEENYVTHSDDWWNIVGDGSFSDYWRGDIADVLFSRFGPITCTGGSICLNPRNDTGIQQSGPTAFATMVDTSLVPVVHRWIVTKGKSVWERLGDNFVVADADISNYFRSRVMPFNCTSRDSDTTVLLNAGCNLAVQSGGIDAISWSFTAGSFAVNGGSYANHGFGLVTSGKSYWVMATTPSSCSGTSCGTTFIRAGNDLAALLRALY